MQEYFSNFTMNQTYEQFKEGIQKWIDQRKDKKKEFAFKVYDV